MNLHRIACRSSRITTAPTRHSRLISGSDTGFITSKFNTLPFSLHIAQRLNSTMADGAPPRRLQNPVIFVCDLQDKFRKAIWQFDKVLLTTQKILRAASILDIPIVVTTQNAAKLGDIVSELQPLLKSAISTTDKTKFSMFLSPDQIDSIPPSSYQEKQTQTRDIALVGIESHICITQTALDLLGQGHKVYVLADGVSSCNAEEVPIALARLRAAGVVVTTSESWLYEVMGDAAIPAFRDIAKLVKETGEDTRAALGGLLSSRI